ncbi:hypothetical protein niasHS_010452 [Heterodera schachtii]|uniref:Uncharacterized protein n=1 Tax=Heterodera schachtii TaxID=97005 RepID=A0ABD2J6Z5_HETSC
MSSYTYSAAGSSAREDSKKDILGNLKRAFFAWPDKLESHVRDHFAQGLQHFGTDNAFRNPWHCGQRGDGFLVIAAHLLAIGTRLLARPYGRTKMRTNVWASCTLLPFWATTPSAPLTSIRRCALRPTRGSS